MVEISEGPLIEFYRNAADDPLGERRLDIVGKATAATSTTITSDRGIPRDIVAGKKIEVKHPTDLTKWEIRTIASISGNVITVTSAFTNTYGAGAFIYKIQEKDYFDSTVSDRTEANVFFQEAEYREAD